MCVCVRVCLQNGESPLSQCNKLRMIRPMSLVMHSPLPKPSLWQIQKWWPPTREHCAVCVCVCVAELITEIKVSNYAELIIALQSPWYAQQFVHPPVAVWRTVRPKLPLAASAPRGLSVSRELPSQSHSRSAHLLISAQHPLLPPGEGEWEMGLAREKQRSRRHFLHFYTWYSF